MKRWIAALLAAVIIFVNSGCLAQDNISNTTGATSEGTQQTQQTTSPDETEPAQTHPAETEPTQTDPTETEPTGTEAKPTEPEYEDDEFVLITDLIPNAKVALAYATTVNFTGKQIYGFTDAYLRYGTVLKLAQAARELEALGFGIVIWDAYRPVYAQQKLWDAYPDPQYVSKPGTGTQAHCRGIAVDLTLYDLASGELVEMPTEMDNFTARADRDYSDCTAQAAENALLLEQIMSACGFKPYSAEWWHYSDTTSYDIEYEFDPSGGSSVTEPDVTDSALNTVLGSVWYATCNNSMALREKSDSNSKSLATVYPNDTMTLLAWEGRHAKVSYKGKVGYVLTNYIKPVNEDYLDQVLDMVENDASYTYSEMMADLQQFVEAYPDLVTLDSIGFSEWGTEIPVLRVGSEDAEHHVLVHASLHAREHFTTWLVMAMLDYWLDGDAALCSDVCYHIIPMVNPDGVETVLTGKLNDYQKQIYLSDLAAGYTDLSESEYAREWKANGMGVDLNRNFDADWDKINYRSSPSSMLYEGEAPFSAAEAAALRDYTLAWPFEVTISYHTTGSILYYDYGSNVQTNAVSKTLAQAVNKVTGYPLIDSTEVDSAGYKDWAIDALGIPSVTVEVGIAQPVSYRREAWSCFARNCDVLTAIARWVREQ